MIVHSNFGTPEWEAGPSNHRVKDVLEFLWASGIHKNTGVMSCEDSIAHCTKWFADRGYSLYDAPVKGYIEEALSDPTLEPGYRLGLEKYMTEYRSILYVSGRHAIEDVPGQWRLEWQHRDETAPRVEKLTSQEECLDFIRGRLDTFDLEDLFEAKTYGEITEGGEVLTTTKHLGPDSPVKGFGSKQPFYVRSGYGDYYKECTKKNVKAAIAEAIDVSRLHLARQNYILYKRVIPAGDPKWGNWWKQVRVKSI
jgi:hypothetical protein